MIDCLYCKRQKDNCDANPCEAMVKQNLNRETGYYWAFLAEAAGFNIMQWTIIYYDSETEDCNVIGSEEKAKLKDFKYVGTTQITKPTRLI